MASKTLSKDQQNFIWISIACVEFLKLPLKDILFNQIKPADLYQRINTSPTNKMDYLRKEQENICFIQPPGQPDYNDFDVTLLYTLIRNLCSASLNPTSLNPTSLNPTSLNPTSLNPTKGWGKVPDPSHMRIGDDIERLRLMRNKFAHANSAGIPDAEFQALWNELKSVFQRVQTFMNSMGSNVNYEQKLADIERNDFGYGDLQKYKLFLEATLNQLKEEIIKDEAAISITGANRVVWGDTTWFKADLKQEETFHWAISWQRVRGSVTNQIDISNEKYSDSTETKLVIYSVCKDDQGEYQAVLARESNGNKRKIESNAIFLHVVGELPVFEVWKVTTEMESVTIHYKVKNSSPRVYDIKWIKNGEGLNFKTQKYVGGGLSDSFLRITSPNETDKGTYSCTLTNAVGCTSKDVTFDLPEAVISTESKVYLGSTAEITSKVSSFLPLNKHKWQKRVDGIEYIDITERKYQASDELKNPFLFIRNTTFDDIRHYRLLVCNILGGSVSNAVFLNVIGNPPNITCSHETCFGSKSVKLIAKVYLYDSCHAIQKVVWTVNDEEIDQQGLGGKFSEVSVDSPCLTIHNVNCYDAGSYKLTATNAVGSTTSDAIVLNIPEVSLAKFDEKEDGTQWFTVIIESIPEPFLVQWRKREKGSDRFQPINVNAEEFKGSSCSFPHSVLVVKLKEQVENFHFQIKIKNFIGTCKKTIQGENEDFLEEMQSPMVQNILETGVDRNIVMQKIKRRARERGDNYQNADDLLNSVLSMDRNSDFLNTNAMQTIPPLTLNPSSRNQHTSNTGYDHLDIENQLIAAQYLEEEHGSTNVYPEFHSLSLPSLTVSDNQIDHRTVRNLMESPIVKTVLSTGVDRQNVMQAIERRLRETGDTYSNADELLNVVLSYQQNFVSHQGLTVSQENVAETQQPMIEAVLDTGVDWNSVMQVIEKRLIETGENYQDAEDLLNAVLVLEQNAGTHMHSTQYSPTMDLEENQGSDFILPDTILSSSDPYTSSDSLSISILTSEYRVDAEVVRANMQLPVVRTVLETGVDRDIVEKVIEKRLRDTGDNFQNAEELMHAVLTLESNSGSSHVPWSISTLRVPLDASPGNASFRIQAAKLAEENRLLQEQRTCKICLDVEVGVVFLPCGHICCCRTCAPKVGQCPVCRTNIQSKITHIDQGAIYQRNQKNIYQMFQEDEGVVEDEFYQVRLLQLGVEVAVAPGEGGVEEEELTKDRTVWNWQQEQERKEKNCISSLDTFGLRDALKLVCSKQPLFMLDILQTIHGENPKPHHTTVTVPS